MANDPTERARTRRLGGVMVDFDGSRLSLARRMRRMPRTTLADKTKVSAAAVTQFEKGQSRPTNAAAAELSLALGVPVEFFRRGRPIDLIPSSEVHFRSLRSTPAITRDQALAFAEISLAIVDLIEQYIDLPPSDVPLQPIDVDDILTRDDIAAIADHARRELGLGSGPVPNVVRLLESRGVVVLRFPPSLDSRVDAFSTSAGHRSLVMLSEQKGDRARSRFDAAHELGHLVMHPGVEPGSKLVEEQAHQFAAEFLAPAAELLKELPRRLDWAQLHMLKAKWGISLKALAFRAHSLELWSDATYRRSMQILAEQGYPEAGPLGPPESPSLVGAAVALLEDSGIPLDSVAEAGRVPTDTLRQVVVAGSETRPRLRLATD
jgi:Zn-dependent peptidase ImmA (M78 family)/DNA-binding XRE family transcriptional regulator